MRCNNLLPSGGNAYPTCRADWISGLIGSQPLKNSGREALIVRNVSSLRFIFSTLYLQPRAKMSKKCASGQPKWMKITFYWNVIFNLITSSARKMRLLTDPIANDLQRFIPQIFIFRPQFCGFGQQWCVQCAHVLVLIPHVETSNYSDGVLNGQPQVSSSPIDAQLTTFGRKHRLDISQITVTYEP